MHMLRMRRLEEQVIHLAEDHALLRAHYHDYIGQEAAVIRTAERIVAAVRATLGR